MNPDCSAIGLCGTTIIEDLFSDAVVPASSSASLVQEVSENFAYIFTGHHEAENWVEVSDQTKADLFAFVDNQPFMLSFWISVDSSSSSSYIFSFENNANRYFTLYESSRTRVIFYYFRDTLSGLQQTSDLGYETQVALSFFYDTDIFPNGLRDHDWHFIALEIDYPSISITIDGYVLRPTQGNYFDSTDSRINLNNDGTVYEMPAPLLVKSQAVINSLTGYIGGSGRGVQFALDGGMRQLILTAPLSTDMYNCLGSCDVGIVPDNSVTGFNTFYNPAKLSFEFSSSAAPNVPVGDTEYTEYMGTLIFSDNGFLSPEEDGESWRVSVQVCHIFALWYPCCFSYPDIKVAIIM